MQRSFLLLFTLTVLALSFGCGGSNTVNADTPTAAYKQLYAAVKSKDIEAIKKNLTKKTIQFGAMAAERNNTPLEKIYENGMTMTTFSETLPTIRDERVNDNMGAVEVWNSKESRWEDLPFMIEDGAWKFAWGDNFAGSFKSPGLGRSEREKEAANAMAPPAANQPPNVNANAAPIETKVPGGPPMDKRQK